MRTFVLIMSGICLVSRIFEKKKKKDPTKLDQSFATFKSYGVLERNVFMGIIAVVGSFFMFYYVAAFFAVDNVFVKVLSFVQILSLYPSYFNPDVMDKEKSCIYNKKYKYFNTVLDLIYYPLLIFFL